MGYSRPPFTFIFVFSRVKHEMFIFADNWIQTTVFRYQKRLLCHLSHCPRKGTICHHSESYQTEKAMFYSKVPT